MACQCFPHGHLSGLSPFQFGDQLCTTLDVFFCCVACLGHARIFRPVNTRLRRRFIKTRCDPGFYQFSQQFCCIIRVPSLILNMNLCIP